MTQELKNPELLNDKEIEQLLPELADVKAWIKKVEDYALEKAKAGTQFKGFKLVEGRSIARYTNENELIKRLEKNGYDKAIFYKTPELISVSDFKKIVKRSYADYEDLIEKTQGKLTLVPDSDKRPAVSTIKASDEFKDEIKEAQKINDNDDLI